MESKKYIIMKKNKNSLIENEFYFYKSSIEITNSIIDDNIDFENEYLLKNLIYLGKVRYNKLKSVLEFFNSFDEIEGNLLVNKGITEDKFVFISERFKSIELFCLLDKYFYTKKKELNNKNGYYSRLTALYGDTIDQESLDVKPNNDYLDCNLIDNIRQLFSEDKLSALENACCFNNLKLNTNIKFINAGQNNKRKDEECVICLEKLGNRYAKLFCKHRFHISCLNDWMKANQNTNESEDSIKEFKITCPLCREEKSAITNINLLDSKLPFLSDGKVTLDFLPIKSNKISQKNIQLVDFLGNIGFKMLKIDDSCYSLEYNDEISSKMNFKISKILSIINIIS
tara:strand:+ start:12491 stop:13516 length:1026 start_codon:yes stop_codon:yes gene_type:complete